MTDRPDDPRDELASAHLDGLTTPEEAERVAADPDLQHRVAALRAVQEAVRSGTTVVDAGRREQAIAAALAAFAEDHAGSDEPGAGAPVGDLAAVAARRSERATRWRRVLGVAAAAVVLALSVPVLGSLGSDDDSEDLATEAADEAAPDSTTMAAGDAEADTGQDATGYADSLSTDAPTADRLTVGVIDLGSFAAYADLEASVRTQLDPAAAGPSPGTSESRAVDDQATACTTKAVDDATAAGAFIALQAVAVLDDRAVTVTVVQHPDSRRTILVADPERACELVATSELAAP